MSQDNQQQTPPSPPEHQPPAASLALTPEQEARIQRVMQRFPNRTRESLIEETKLFD